MKWPSLPVFSVRFSPVPTFVKVTGASTTAAPDWSVTVPEIEPYVDCACKYKDGINRRMPSDNTNAKKRRDDMVSPKVEMNSWKQLLKAFVGLHKLPASFLEVSQ